MLALAVVALCSSSAATARGQDSGILEVGKTGFDVKRPVLASACEDGCPWGELGDFLTQALQPLGYDVVQCRNCDQSRGPPLVAKAGHPPPIDITDTAVGTTTTVDAPVDFGITESGFLRWAYDGLYSFAASGPFASGVPGPFRNLRLIARIEDPTYLLVAVKASSGITDLSQVAAKKMAVTIVGGDTPISARVLDYYGLTQSAVTSWGGSIQNAIFFGQLAGAPFDVIVSELGSPANNPESAFWTKLSQANDLSFLDLPEPLLARLAEDSTLGLTRVTAKWGLLRGVDRPIATVARSGHVIFGRDDMPDQVAYDIAKSVDQNREGLKWFIRPYSYDPRTAWQNLDVPLHPGAQQYYEDVGYMTGAPSAKGGCRVGSRDIRSSPATAPAFASVVSFLTVALLRRRARRA